MELLRKNKIEEELRRTKREGMLHIQPLAIKLSLHSSSSLECAKRKAYNEKMQFAQMIIHDIYRIRTSIVEFFNRSRRSWHVKE